MQDQKFSFKARFKSIGFAIAGLIALIKTEHNVRIHLIATVLVVISGLIFHISSAEWLALVFAIALVMISEIFNTVIELLCDYISPGQDTRIGKIKDIAAGAVLVSAVVAMIIGVIIFLPKIYS